MNLVGFGADYDVDRERVVAIEIDFGNGTVTSYP
jgi:hypothetical protein